MQSITHFIRQSLARMGFEIKRIQTPVLAFGELLHQISGENGRGVPDQVLVFDDDARIQAEIVSYFGPKACLRSLPFFQGLGAQEEPPTGKFWVALGLERCAAANFFDLAPWAKSADVFVTRCILGAFESGDVDYAETVAVCERFGFSLVDVSLLGQPIQYNAASSRIILLFARNSPANPTGREFEGRAQRLDEATAFFSEPIARKRDFRWMAGIGSFGFSAGVFNPGALNLDDKLLLVARGEHIPWTAQSKDESQHFSSWRPLLMESSEDVLLVRATELKFTGLPEVKSVRVEDFRLFRFQDRILCNHSVITLPDNRSAKNQPVKLETQRVRVGLSQVRCEERELRLLGFPRPDFPVNSIEKNWAMFVRGNDLFVIYSVAPYRVLRVESWPGMELRSVIECRIAFPFAPDRRLVRNSINPIDYSPSHYLHIVHLVYPSKQYVFWGLLIDRATLQPTHCSRHPIARAGTSLGASIIYACSAIARGNKILLFAGINDSACGCWTIDRATLDAQWMPLPR